jgi:hypothetical protein
MAVVVVVADVVVDCRMYDHLQLQEVRFIMMPCMAGFFSGHEYCIFLRTDSATYCVILMYLFAINLLMIDCFFKHILLL